MALAFFQIPVVGGRTAVEEMNRLLCSGRIGSVSKKFASNGDDSFWALGPLPTDS